MITVDCLADCHGHYPKLEGGDLLIVAGDLTARDSAIELYDFMDWIMNDCCYKKRIVIAGNHDNILRSNERFMIHNVKNGERIEYLCDSGTEFQHFCSDGRDIFCGRNYKIWGSPWTKTFEGMNPHCMAFTVDTEEELAEKWALIPDDIDILVTHSPSYGVLDEVRRFGPFSHERDESVGSESLIKPMIKSGCRLHVFGHIHEGHGKFYNPINGIIYVNASHVNERYEPVNKPIRIEL